MIRPAPPRTPPRTPTPPREIIRDGLDNHTIQVQYAYPPGFSPDGEGARVAKVNSALLLSYQKLETAYNELSLAKAIEKHNKPRVDSFQKDDLSKDVDEAQKLFDSLVSECRDYLGEVDAIGGAQAVYCPDELRDLIGELEKWRRVESGSLSELKKAPPYISEECIPPAEVFKGKNGPVNMLQKKHFEGIAFFSNRIKYLQTCGCKGDELKAPVKRLFHVVNEVIKHAGDGILLMPRHLREVAGYLLSDALKDGLLKEEFYDQNRNNDMEEAEDSEQDVMYVESPSEARRRRDNFVSYLENRERNMAQKSAELSERLLDLENEEKAEAKRQKRRKKD